MLDRGVARDNCSGSMPVCPGSQPTWPPSGHRHGTRPWSGKHAFPQPRPATSGHAAWRGLLGPVTVIDPAIESHYGTGYERSRLFPGGRPSLEYVRSMELLEQLLPRPAGPGAGCRGRPGRSCRPAGQARVPGASGGSGAVACGAGTPGGIRRSGCRLHRRLTRIPPRATEIRSRSISHAALSCRWWRW